MMQAYFRASDRAVYAHNVHLTFTTSHGHELPWDVMQAILEHFRSVDNYGLEKIRAVAIESRNRVHVIVAIPPNRSVAQVAQRLKSFASLAIIREFPGYAGLMTKGRTIWQRGYQIKDMGSRTMGEIGDYLGAIVAPIQEVEE